MTLYSHFSSNCCTTAVEMVTVYYFHNFLGEHLHQRTFFMAVYSSSYLLQRISYLVSHENHEPMIFFC